MNKKPEEIFDEFVRLSHKREEQFDEVVELVKRSQKHAEQIDGYFKDIVTTSEILKIFQDTNKSEIREFAKRLVEGRNETAETKGEVKQMDKRIEDSNNWMRNQTKLLISTMLGMGAIIIGLLIKIAFF